MSRQSSVGSSRVGQAAAHGRKASGERRTIYNRRNLNLAQDERVLNTELRPRFWVRDLRQMRGNSCGNSASHVRHVDRASRACLWQAKLLAEVDQSPFLRESSSLDDSLANRHFRVSIPAANEIDFPPFFYLKNRGKCATHTVNMLG